ncbi:MAG: hypothetical protein KIT68_11945, partial [Phycisphaeraceae bacterium]|nr:hypothetical protein [Phycisphaeraceae bacterium]
ADLRAAFSATPPIPTAIDRAILDDARGALRPRPRVIFTFRRAAVALSTAAALALVAYITLPTRRPAGPLGGVQLSDNRTRPVENATRSREFAGPRDNTPAAPDAGGTPRRTASGSTTDRRLSGGLPPPPDRDVALSSKPKAEAHEPTIVDALRIAIAVRDQQADARAGRQLRRLDELYDLNGDGVIDLRDADALAQRVVSLQAHPRRDAEHPVEDGGAG